jgi:glutamate-1-semialdehyde 2,1-aminomutase
MKIVKPKISKSNKVYNYAKKTIPSGGQTFSKGVTQFVEGFAPKYLESGKGAYSTDLDGNRYIDYVMGCHPIILGYADPDVNKAVTDQLKKGSTFSLHNKLEVEVTKMMIDAIPSAEMVRFGKNGSDATTVGVRVARAYTKRDHIAYCGYHGWHDWFIANTDLNAGIPNFNKKLAHSFNYNDLGSLEALFKKYKNKIAVVIMEPLTVSKPKCYGPKSCKNLKCKKFCQNNFLTEVKKITKKNGALLMFDEVITGFRFGLGGAQEKVGVTPDLSSFAKAMSNGIPISAIVGKKEYMKHLDKIFFSFAYGGDCLGLAATKATINKIKKKKVINHLYQVGDILQKGINQLARDHQLDDFFSCPGFSCRTIFSINGQKKFKELEVKSFIQQELFRRGVLWAAYHALSYSHKAKEINTTLNALDQIFSKFKNKFIKNNLNLRNNIEGKVVRPVFRRVADFNSYTTKK